MRDPEETIKRMDEISVPNQWERIRSGVPRPKSGEPFTRRLLAGVVAACVALAGTILVVKAFDGTGSIGPGSPALHGTPVSESVLLKGGEFRCIVHFPSDALSPGSPTGVSFTLVNVSSKDQIVGLGINGEAGTFRLRDGSGTLLADTALDHDGIFGPSAAPHVLHPGASVKIGSDDTWMAWPGPVFATPSCGGAALPPVRLDILARGAAPSVAEAIALATPHVTDLNSCPPPSGGGETTGTVTIKNSGQPETLQARCGAIVQQFGGFDVVTLYVITPADAPKVDVAPLAAKLGYAPWPIGVQGAISINWWRFAVTRSAARAMKAYSVHQGCSPITNVTNEGGSGGGPRAC